MTDSVFIPGNADVPVGEAMKRINKRADRDVGVPRQKLHRTGSGP